MIRKPEGFEEAQAMDNTVKEKLEAGGYILEMKRMVLDSRSTKDGRKFDVLVFLFDIAEGEKAGYFGRKFEAEKKFGDAKWKGKLEVTYPTGDGSDADKFNLRKLKSVVVALQDSNEGYSFYDANGNANELAIKGKKVGAVFGEKEWEYNGYSGTFTVCRWFTSIETIRSGEFSIPKVIELKKNDEDFTPEVAEQPLPNGMHALDDDIPF